MSDQLEQMQNNIVAAVQQELTRYSKEVAGEVSRIREDLATGAAARTELEGQVRALASALEQSQRTNSDFQGEIQHALEERLKEFSSATKRRHDEMNTRLGRVVDEANTGIAAAVESAARPIMKQVEHRQDKVEADLKILDGSLRKFDDQAGKMVTHINQVTNAIEARLEQVSTDVLNSFDERHAALVLRIDEVSAAAARQQAEVNNIVGTRVDASEDRINERIVGLESRVNEEIGQRVADIDAHVGRIGAGLDDAVVTLNDRIAKADNRFAEVEAEFAKIREDLASVDAEAIDEMKDKIGSALGEAELVRIEMDRFKVEIGGTVDKVNVRLTELETTVQDQHMDVETAVQLERLEEVERAMLLIDPDQFVRRDELDDISGSGSAVAGSGAGSGAGSDYGSASADGEMGAIGAIDSLKMAPLTDETVPMQRLTPSATAPLAPPTAEPPTSNGSSPNLPPVD